MLIELLRAPVIDIMLDVLEADDVLLPEVTEKSPE